MEERKKKIIDIRDRGSTCTGKVIFKFQPSLEPVSPLLFCYFSTGPTSLMKGSQACEI